MSGEIMGSNRVKITMASGDFYKKLTRKRKIFNSLIWFPMANRLPEKFGTWIFTRSSEHTRLIRQYATTHQALELMYSHDGFSLNGNGLIDSVLTWFWESNVLNAHAVRNRIKLVKKELKDIVSEKTGQEETKILSLASGSARAVIEAMSELKKDGISTKARLVDMSRDALNYSKELAEQYGVTEQIKWTRANVLNIDKYCQDWQPDIVEMVGLMDYLDDKTAIELITKIHNHLAPNGSLIFSNINHNPEQRFVEKIVNWKQIYRTPQQVGEIIVAGGFASQHCRIIREPLGIQTVAFGTKSE